MAQMGSDVFSATMRKDELCLHSRCPQQSRWLQTVLTEDLSWEHTSVTPKKAVQRFCMYLKSHRKKYRAETSHHRTPTGVNPSILHTVPLTNLPVVTELVAILLALVGADEELQVVLLKDLLCHIRPKVAATTSHCIYSAAVLRHGVTPENV